MSMGRYIPAAISAAILCAGLVARSSNQLEPSDVEAYHSNVALVVAQIPYRWGDWEGVDTAVPPSAQKLLRPNAMLARTYRNRASGQSCEVLLVHCSDTRDMLGHYPPVCYPAHGWETRAAGVVTIAGTLHGSYTFERLDDGQARVMEVANFFSIPGTGRVPDMVGLRDAAEARWRHSLGAGQVQIIVHGDTPAHERAAIIETFEQMLAPATETIERWAP